MSSKVAKKSNKDSKVVKCKNCRQDILKDKMFLHEGFCARNNIFCEHCEKVFLKKDYEEHVKSFKKLITIKEIGSPTNSQKSKETQSETMKPSSYTEENDNLSNNISLAPKPSLEVVQMPITELYKINAPIFVSETGHIISDKNKNENILPFLGLNFRSSKISEKILDDIIEQGDIFKENNTISQNCYDFQGLTNLVNKNNINSKTINSNNIDLRNSDSSFGSSFKENNSIYKNSIIRELNSPTSRTIEINKINENKENIQINSNINNNKKFNTLYINKSIANNSQKIFKKRYNFLTFQQTPQKVPVNNTHINSSLKRSEKLSMPLDKTSRRTPKRPIYKNPENSIEKSHYNTYKKEPKDSNSKKNRNSNKIHYKFNYFKENSQIIDRYDSEIKDNNDNNKYIFSRFDTHIPLGKSKKTKSTRIFDIPKPKRRGRKQYSEEFILEDIDEIGIDEKKRETLTRQFNASTLNVISLNCEKKPIQVNNKKINNLSPDNNKICLNGIKKNKSQSINNLKNWEIDNLVFFNNDKKVLKHPKDKTSIRNIIII